MDMFRQHRSKNVYYHPPLPPPPPAKPPVPDATENRTYLLTEIQQGLAQKKIAQCQLEFLDVGSMNENDPNDINRYNHAILRLTFAHQLQDDTPYAQIGTRGVILDLRDDSEDDANISNLIIKTFWYEGPHKDALHWVNLPMYSGKTLRDCLNIIRNSGSTPCYLDYSNDNLVGCRDFVSQLIYHLDRNRFLKLLADANSAIYDSFNSKYRSGGNAPVPANVDYALFRRTYNHVNINAINYTGIRQFIV